MAQFSEADINAAKRRVQEMQNRASRFTAEPTQTVPPPINNREQKNQEHPQNDIPLQTDTTPQDEKEEQDKDKSFFIILALILLLSKEGADNTLILALLYLLL